MLILPHREHRIHSSLKETQWEGTSPVFLELATGRKEKKFFSPAGCLATVQCFPGHRPCQGPVSGKGLQVYTTAHWFSFLSSGFTTQSYSLTKNMILPHCIWVHKTKFKAAAVLASFTAASWEVFLSLGRKTSLLSFQFPNWSFPNSP